MVLWEITLGTAYFLGLKRTYRLALRIQRRIVNPNHSQIRQFLHRYSLFPFFNFPVFQFHFLHLFAITRCSPNPHRYLRHHDVAFFIHIFTIKLILKIASNLNKVFLRGVILNHPAIAEIVRQEIK